MTDPAAPSVLRLYLLGSLSKEKASRTLTTFGEYKALRGLSRITLNTVALSELTTAIGALRGYIEGGFPDVDLDTLKTIGGRLFDILITGRTRDLFLTATGDVMSTGDFLPLEIVAEDFEIAGWPWEYLWDPTNEQFITQEFHPISRSIFSMSSRPSLNPKQGPLRILIILGVGPDDPYTTPEEEIEVIRDVFETHLATDDFELKILPASDYQRLQTGISREEVDILHYFGHAQFDYQRKQGFLSIARPGKDPFPIYAGQLAGLLIGSRVRLVFLNACKTALGSATENPGRSSVAAALLDRGIPAVIGTQFSLPDVSAHSLSATIYNSLLTGKTIGESVRIGRNAMSFADRAKFFDWGIPVLYSTNPNQVLFPSRTQQPRSTPSSTSVVISERSSKSAPDLGTFELSDRPAVVVGRTRPEEAETRLRVVIVDIDSKVGFLADTVILINRIQNYYHFEVAYPPVPGGYVRTDLSRKPQTFVPRLSSILLELRDDLRADYLCGLTQHLIAGEVDGDLYWNFFTSSILADNTTFVVSTFDLRRYAHEAGVAFPKAVVGLCLSMLVASDSRWGIEFHDETAGCLFDFCEERDDIVVGLQKTHFDHEACRKKIKDPAQMEAIDAFYATDFSKVQHGG